MSQVLTAEEILDLVRQRFPGEEAAILQIIGRQAAILRAQLASDGGDLVGVDPPPGYTSGTLNALLAEVAANAAPAVHGHAIAQVTGLQAALDAKLDDAQATPAGLALLGAADAAAQRSALALGSAAQAATMDFAPSSHVGVGGAAHATATSAAAGFMSAADKTKLDGIAASATNTPLASTTPAALGTAAVGTGTTAARADHVHALPTPAAIGAAPTAHTHAAADLTSGTLDIARLPVAPSGASSTTQVVRADDARLNDARTPTTHTHAAADVTDFAAAARSQIEAAILAGTNVTITPAGTGATRTLTLSATGGVGNTDWTIVTAGQTLADDVPLLAVITTAATFPIPASVTVGHAYILRNASTSTVLASIDPGAGRQIQGCPVAGILTIAPGETAHLVARTSTAYEIV